MIVTDDNPRTRGPGRDPGRGAGRRAAARRRPARVVEVAGGGRRSPRRCALAEPGDVVAVLGKGHERGQEIAGEVRPFDDRVELAAALTDRFATAEAGRDPADAGRDRGGRRRHARAAATRTTVVTGPVEFDSRQVGAGRAVRRVRRRATSDGHDFAGAALAAGAVAVLGTRPVAGADDRRRRPAAPRWAALARAVLDRLPGPDGSSA